jgi:hypothetical protein
MDTIPCCYEIPFEYYYAWKSQDVLIALQGHLVTTHFSDPPILADPNVDDADQLVQVQAADGQEQSIWKSTGAVSLSAVEVSPDGQWALMRQCLPDAWKVVNLETHQVITAPVSPNEHTFSPSINRFQATWTPDSQHWLVLIGDAFHPILLIYSLTPPTTPTKLYLKPFPTDQVHGLSRLVGLTSRGTALAIIEPTSSSTQMVHCYEFAITGERRSDPHHKVAVHAYDISLPIVAAVKGLALSPQEDRLAWMLVTDRHGAVWISQVDGSQMHLLGRLGAYPKIGHLPEGYQIVSSYDRSFAYAFPLQIRWRPDGKRLSFLYEKSLWTVPAN